MPVIATPLMPPELARNSPHLALGVRQHTPIVCRFLYFVG
jgi:hypothetical protein